MSEFLTFYPGDRRSSLVCGELTRNSNSYLLTAIQESTFVTRTGKMFYDLIAKPSSIYGVSERLLGVDPNSRTRFGALEQILWRANLGIGEDLLQDGTEANLPNTPVISYQTHLVISPTLEQARFRLKVFSEPETSQPAEKAQEPTLLLSINLGMVYDLADRFRLVVGDNVADLLATGQIPYVKEAVPKMNYFEFLREDSEANGQINITSFAKNTPWEVFANRQDILLASLVLWQFSRLVAPEFTDRYEDHKAIPPDPRSYDPGLSKKYEPHIAQSPDSKN